MIKQTSVLASLIALGSISLSASTLVPSIASGSCIRGLSELPKENITVSTEDPDGFVIFVAFDSAQRDVCAPTIKNPTNGFHKVSIEDGKFTATIDKEALEKIACGIIIQFDFHMRLPGGLLADLDSPGFFSLLYNSNLEARCYDQNGNMGYNEGGDNTNPSSIRPNNWVSGTNPKDNPVLEVNPLIPTPVPEPSTFALIASGLAYFWRKRVNKS